LSRDRGVKVLTLKREAARSSEMMVSYHDTQHHKPEDLNLNHHCHEKLISE
jgi:hypothetical protein